MGGQLGKSFGSAPPKLAGKLSCVCRFLFGVLFFCMLMCGSVSAQSSYYVVDPDDGGRYLVYNGSGEQVFDLKFFDPGDGEFTQGQSLSRNFTVAKRNAIADAAVYWTDVLNPTGQMPVVLNPDGTLGRNRNR